MLVDELNESKKFKCNVKKVEFSNSKANQNLSPSCVFHGDLRVDTVYPITG